MLAHFATFTVRNDQQDRLPGILGPSKSMIAAIPGLRLWLLTANPDTGEGVMIAVFEDEETQKQGNREVEKMLSGFVETLTSPWHIADSQVLAFADNDWRDLVANA